MHCIGLNLTALESAQCSIIFPFMEIWTKSMFIVYEMYKTVKLCSINKYTVLLRHYKSDLGLLYHTKTNNFVPL